MVGFHSELRQHASLAILAGACWLVFTVTGCGVDPLYCCSTVESCRRDGGDGILSPCQEPARPYCDDAGYFGPLRTCIPQPAAQVCGAAADCPSEQPVCIDHFCAQCENDAQCGSASSPVCDQAAHACVGCAADDDCGDVEGAPRCLSEQGMCVACVGPEDCAGDAPVCAANTCVECAVAADCRAAAPVCGEDGMCRGCAADAECASQVCDVEGGGCFDEAALIYVAMTGRPDGTCTKAAPCDSFAQALTQVSDARNVIKVAPGMYEGPVEIDGIAVTILADGATIQPAAENQPVVSVSGGADATIEGMTITGARGPDEPVGVTCAGATSVLRLRRSTVITNTGGGISIAGCQFSFVNNVIAINGGLTSTFGGVQISNIGTEGFHEFSFNTVTANGGGTDAVNGVECASITVPLVFSNNIVFGNDGVGADTQVGNDDSCSWTYSDIGPATVTGTGNINEDPQFVDPSADNRDFHLLPSSPARNAADPAATLGRDIDGDTRPAGVRSDMGADEVLE